MFDPKPKIITGKDLLDSVKKLEKDFTSSHKVKEVKVENKDVDEQAIEIMSPKSLAKVDIAMDQKKKELKEEGIDEYPVYKGSDIKWVY